MKYEEEIEKINEEKVMYNEKFSELDELYTKYVYQIKSMEQTINEKKAVYEHNIILQAENAYHDYLSQQYQTFENINRTYGAKVNNKFFK